MRKPVLKARLPLSLEVPVKHYNSDAYRGGFFGPPGALRDTTNNYEGVAIMRTFWPVLMGISVVLCSDSAGAQAEKEIQLDIQPQVLVDALNEWAQAAGFRLIGPASATRHLPSPRLQGTFTPQAALDRLLAGTTLTYEFLDERTVAIHERLPGSLPAPTPVAGKQVDKHFLRLTAAQVDEARRSSNGGAAESENPSANARESDNNKRQLGTLEEVIVTAQKREERLQEVPISISVLGGDDLDRSTAEGVTDVLTRVPGVATTVGFQGGGTQVAIRGVAAGGNSYFGSSPVAYYLDSAPFGLVKSAFGPDSNAYDLERVEVLRGPQGTLYGASAQNGVVRVLTHDADLDEFEVKARTSVSTTEGGGENYRGDMAVNLPIVEGKLAARAVIGYQDLSGWIDRPNKNKEDANDAEIGNMRLKINAQPIENLSIGLSAWLSRADYGGPSVADDNGQHAAILDEPISIDYDVYGVKIGYDFPWFSVASMTSYLDYAQYSVLDQIVQVGFSTLLTTDHPSDVFSQEINLTSTHGGSWRWSLGSIYRDAEERIAQTFVFFAAPIDFTDTSESFAVFGEVTRLFLDGSLELTAGLRYFEDDVGVRENVRHTGVPGEPLVQASSKFHKVTPRVVLTWHPNDQITVYGSYSEGFRSGFNQQPTVINLVPEFPPAKPDLLKNYELGAKGSLWGGRVNFDTALYFIDWQDVQQPLVVPFGGILVTALVNGESASGTGYEFAVTAEPVEGLELGVNFSWNDLAMDADVISSGVVLFDKGDRLNFSPEYTVGASADYVFPIGGAGFEGRFSASANYTSEQEHRTLRARVPRITVGDPMLIARTSFSVDAPDHWTATIFVDNVNNEQGTPIRQPFSLAVDRDARVRPRTVGVQLECRF